MRWFSSTKATAAGRGALSLHFATAVILILAAVGLQLRTEHSSFPLRVPPGCLPTRIDGWSGTDYTFANDTLVLFRAVELLNYRNESKPQPEIVLDIEDFPVHAKTRPTPHGASRSTPREIVWIARPDGTSFRVNRYVESRFRARIFVLYWFQVHGRALASEWWARYYLIFDSIPTNRSDGALVRLTSRRAGRLPTNLSMEVETALWCKVTR